MLEHWLKSRNGTFVESIRERAKELHAAFCRLPAPILARCTLHDLGILPSADILLFFISFDDGSIRLFGQYDGPKLT